MTEIQQQDEIIRDTLWGGTGARHGPFFRAFAGAAPSREHLHHTAPNQTFVGIAPFSG